MLLLIICAVWGIIPLLVNYFKNWIASLLSIVAGICPLLFISMIEGKIPLPEHDISNWIGWLSLVLSAPLFLCSALMFKRSNSAKARNTAFIGVFIGGTTSLYTWSLLSGFGV